MKNRIISLMLLACITILCFVSCGEKPGTDDLWANALYTENTEMGSGEVSVTLEVKVLDKSVEFVINTDKQYLGDALIEHSLIEGETGAYGLYVKKVNGILADFDKDQSYWALKKDGETMMVGVDGAKISDGEHYELEYTK